MLEEESACSGCGLPLEETTDDEADLRYAVTEYRCRGCEARAAAAEGGKPYAGRLLHVHRRPDPHQAS